MNTPANPNSRRQQRRGKRAFAFPSNPDGTYTSAILDTQIAAALGEMIAAFEHLESSMGAVVDTVLGTHGTGGLILRTLKSPRARIDLMEALIQQELVMGLDPIYGEFVREFSKLNTRRNGYVHGLWFSREEGSGFATYLAETDEHTLALLRSRPVDPDELPALASDIFGLAARIRIKRGDVLLEAQRLAHPEQPPAPTS
jgi:hypothetical protein